MDFVNHIKRSFGERSKLAVDRMRYSGQPSGLILMYHRVATPVSDPWGLAVSPENFAAQMAVLARRRQARPTSEFAEQLTRDGARERSVVVTFDDGYLDNLTNALPTLEREQVPATLYVMSGAIGDPKAYWWDFLARLFLETTELPETLTLDSPLGSKTWNLDGAATITPNDLSGYCSWDYRDKAGPRGVIFLDVWDYIVALEPSDQRDVVAQIEAWSGQSAAPEDSTLARPMTREELQKMAASDVIEIGGHTVHHPDLSQTPHARAVREIGEGREMLTEMIGEQPISFAYPFGRRQGETEGIVEAAGFTNAVNTEFGVATAAAGRYQLPRIEARNWSGPEFERLLNLAVGPAPQQ